MHVYARAALAVASCHDPRWRDTDIEQGGEVWVSGDMTDQTWGDLRLDGDLKTATPLQVAHQTRGFSISHVADIPEWQTASATYALIQGDQNPSSWWRRPASMPEGQPL